MLEYKKLPTGNQIIQYWACKHPLKTINLIQINKTNLPKVTKIFRDRKL